jgi:hypothetical protein
VVADGVIVLRAEREQADPGSPPIASPSLHADRGRKIRAESEVSLVPGVQSDNAGDARGCAHPTEAPTPRSPLAGPVQVGDSVNLPQWHRDCACPTDERAPNESLVLDPGAVFPRTGRSLAFLRACETSDHGSGVLCRDQRQPVDLPAEGGSQGVTR